LRSFRIAAGLVVELARYLGGSPHSRLRQRAALRELDERLLDDIGLAGRRTVSHRRPGRCRLLAGMMHSVRRIFHR
jgi:uncharacterized protein YjiS (DUF1127 family)